MSSSPSIPKRDFGWYATLLALLLMFLTLNGLCFLFYLSRVPDITFRRDELTFTRLFLARSDGPAGIGLQTQRVTQTLPDDRRCVTVAVRYYMWKRTPQTENQNTTYSHLFAKTPYGWQSTGQPCP